MPNQLLPKRWTSQPQYPTGIDWSNPITRGVNWVAIGGNPFDLISNVALAPLGTPALGRNYYGSTFDTVNATDAYVGVISKVPTAEATLVFHGVLTAISSLALFCGFPHDLSNNGPYANVALGGSRVGGANITLYFSDSIQTLTTMASAGSYPIGSLCTIVATVKTGDQRLYLNGVQTDSGTVALTGGLWQPPTKYMIVGSPVAGRSANTKTALFSAYNRVLTPVEVTDLSTDPWQIFAPSLS